MGGDLKSDLCNQSAQNIAEQLLTDALQLIADIASDSLAVEYTLRHRPANRAGHRCNCSVKGAPQPVFERKTLFQLQPFRCCRDGRIVGFAPEFRHIGAQSGNVLIGIDVLRVRNRRIERCLRSRDPVSTRLRIDGFYLLRIRDLLCSGMADLKRVLLLQLQFLLDSGELVGCALRFLGRLNNTDTRHRVCFGGSRDGVFGFGRGIVDSRISLIPGERRIICLAGDDLSFFDFKAGYRIKDMLGRIQFRIP